MASKHGTSSLKKFLNNHFTNDKELITHTKIKNTESGEGGGSYSINGDNVKTFHELYYNNVFINCKTEHITEKQLPCGGAILIDFDFKMDKQYNNRQHDNDDILNMIDLYLEKMKLILDFDDKEFPLFIFEKPNINKTHQDYNKDGIHIIIGIKLGHNYQCYLRELVLKELPNVWQNLKFINDYDQIHTHGHTYTDSRLCVHSM